MGSRRGRSEIEARSGLLRVAGLGSRLESLPPLLGSIRLGRRLLLGLRRHLLRAAPLALPHGMVVVEELGTEVEVEVVVVVVVTLVVEVVVMIVEGGGGGDGAGL